MLTDGSNSGVLHQGHTWDFTNISRTDSGTYHCTASNGLGPVSRAINVNVTCKYTSDTYHVLLRTHLLPSLPICTLQSNPTASEFFCASCVDRTPLITVPCSEGLSRINIC